MKTKSRPPFSRSPTLDTVIMIEAAASASDGTETVSSLWRKLRRKVMWQTYLVAMDYLEKSGKILIGKGRSVIWVWDKDALARLRKEKLVVA